MQALRTPESRFSDLPDYPFASNFVDLEPDGLRMHYLDEGGPAGETILMLHGEPSWSYLYRFMVPPCVAAGHRVLVPDLIGFGKSDKPTQRADYSYDRHLGWVRRFLDALDAGPMTLVCQDWGSLLGLRIAAEDPHRFSRIVVGNGALPTGDIELPQAFKAWKTFALHSPWFPIGKIVNKGTRRKLSRAEVAAYDAPFPNRRFKAGARAFPALVPVAFDDPGAAENRAAWKALESWNKPLLTAFSTGDPIMRGGDKLFQARVPGARGLPHVRLSGGHFLQEDSGPEFARAVIDLIAATPRRQLDSLGCAGVQMKFKKAVACFVIACVCLGPSTDGLRAASANEIEQIADLLRLERGQVLADVGAGDGGFAELLAAKVGPDGRVFATEVKQELVDEIEQRMVDAGLSQVSAVLGDQGDLGLESGCCDAILLRLVYHHFEEPETMRAGLRRALVPDGLLAIIDIVPQEEWRVLPRVPDRGGHGIPAADLVAEMIGVGFEFVEERSDWNGDEDRYAVLFRRPAEEAASPNDRPE